MKRTLDYLESLPPYEKDEALSIPWPELCRQVFALACDDLQKLLEEAQKSVGRILLPDVVFDQRYALTPYIHVGSSIICPNDTYRERIGQPNLAQIRSHPGPGVIESGMEIEAAMLRRVPAPKYGPDMVHLSYVNLALRLNDTHEIIAFREIYDNYRAIVWKLLDMAPIDFFMSAVIPEVEKVRSKKPVPRLDAVLHLSDPKPDDTIYNRSFELTYPWYPNTDYKEGVRVFRSLAVLFTCIQKAARSPRSKKDHLLQYWNSIRDRTSVYPKRRRWACTTGDDHPSTDDEIDRQLADIQQEWKRKCSQLVETVTAGPFIRPNSKTGEVAPSICHSGFSLSFAADNRRMDSDIFIHDQSYNRDFWRLYVHRAQVPLSLCVPDYLLTPIEQQGYIRLSHVLGVIYSYTKPTCDILEMLNSLAPLFEARGFTSLKRGCFDMIDPALARLGYAVATMNTARDYVRARVVWVFDKYRNVRPLNQYLACGTLRIRFSPDGAPGSVEWLPMTEGDMVAALYARLMKEVSNAKKVLSFAGMKAAKDYFDWRHGIRQNPRRSAHQQRVAFVATHRQLWCDHNKLAKTMLTAGLYSKNTILSQIVYSCEALIKEVQSSSQPSSIGIIQ